MPKSQKPNPRQAHPSLLAPLLLALALAGGSTLASEAPPEMTEDGLKLVHNSEWGLVYAEPGADLSVYDKVQMLDSYVAFRKNWQRDQNRSTAGSKIRGGLNRSYSDSAGDMTIYLEIYDSMTGDLIAKGMDRKSDLNSGFMTWQTSVQNKQAARRILKDWAGSLREALDRAHANTPDAD